MQPADPLSRLLQSWRVAPPASADFRTGVWRRIDTARCAGGESWGAYLRSHLAAWSFVTLLALGGSGWLGHFAAQVKNENARQELVTAYVLSIHPRAQLHP